ncbi:MAG: hypothetical protein MJY71_06445 [Bacteroidaceae bacterium]|nr:hypothetical protein [Bacteroidaceae bacterium]
MLIDSITKIFGSLESDTKALVENETDQLRLKTIKALSVVMSALVTCFVLALVLMAALLFLTMALGQWLGVILENAILGYLIVGGVFLLIFVVLMISKSKLFINRFVSLFVKLFYSEK